jgi:NhaA family Na+:H+ antiporter
MWWFMLHSGIHATVTGLLALLFRLEMEIKIYLIYLQHFLHKPVGFLYPLFALANTAMLSVQT